MHPPAPGLSPPDKPGAIFFYLIYPRQEPWPGQGGQYKSRARTRFPRRE